MIDDRVSAYRQLSLNKLLVDTIQSNKLFMSAFFLNLALPACQPKWKESKRKQEKQNKKSEKGKAN